MLLLLAKVITKVQVFLQSFILDGPVKRLKIKHVYYARQTSPQPDRGIVIPYFKYSQVLRFPLSQE